MPTETDDPQNPNMTLLTPPSRDELERQVASLRRELQNEKARADRLSEAKLEAEIERDGLQADARRLNDLIEDTGELLATVEHLRAENARLEAELSAMREEHSREKLVSATACSVLQLRADAAEQQVHKYQGSIDELRRINELLMDRLERLERL